LLYSTNAIKNVQLAAVYLIFLKNIARFRKWQPITYKTSKFNIRKSHR